MWCGPENRFIAACYEGNLDQIKTLVADPHVDSFICKGVALAMVADHGHAKVVQFLLGDPRVEPTANDNSAMECAMSGDHSEVVKLFVGTGKFNTSYLSEKVFPWAIRKRRQDLVVDLLQNHGVDPTASYSIYSAVMNNCPSILRALLEDGRANPMTTPSVAPVFEIAARKNPEILKMLLDDERVDPTPIAKDCLSMLHNRGSFKVIWDHPRTQHLLNPDELFHTACFLGRLDAVELLIRAPGVHPVLRDLKRGSDLNSGVCEFLIKETELDPSLENNMVMWNAALRGHIGIVEALIADGRASVSEPENNPPIIEASHNGHLNVVKLLIDHGADPAANNNAALKSTLERRNVGIDTLDERRKLVREYLLTFPAVVYKMALPYVNYQLAIAENSKNSRIIANPKAEYSGNEQIVVKLHQIGDLKMPSDISRAVWKFLTNHVAIFQSLCLVHQEVLTGTRTGAHGEFIFNAMACKLEQEKFKYAGNLVRKLAKFLILADIITASGHESLEFVDIQSVIVTTFDYISDKTVSPCDG